MQAFGLFRGRMSSWCSFRCPCLDELGSKSDVDILYRFLLQKCVYFMVFRLWGSWWLFLVWRLLGCWDLVHDKMVVFTTEAAKLSLDSMFADLRSRWIQSIFPNCRLLASSRAECLLLSLFRGRMSSWCSFRCTCLDELESKSDVNILYLFCCKMCVFHGCFFLVWRLLWCCDLVHDKMVVLTSDQQKFRWIRCCWFQASLDSIFCFQNAGFWPLLLGLFRGRMSSWCSFRCTCLDELESKSDVNIL